jgi:hypothetical protein
MSCKQSATFLTNNASISNLLCYNSCRGSKFVTYVYYSGHILAGGNKAHFLSKKMDRNQF